MLEWTSFRPREFATTEKDYCMQEIQELHTDLIGGTHAVIGSLDGLEEIQAQILTGTTKFATVESHPGKTSTADFLPSSEDMPFIGYVGCVVLGIVLVAYIIQVLVSRAWSKGKKVREIIGAVIWASLFLTGGILLSALGAENGLAGASQASYACTLVLTIGGGIVCVAGRAARVLAAKKEYELQKEILRLERQLGEDRSISNDETAGNSREWTSGESPILAVMAATGIHVARSRGGVATESSGAGSSKPSKDCGHKSKGKEHNSTKRSRVLSIFERILASRGAKVLGALITSVVAVTAASLASLAFLEYPSNPAGLASIGDPFMLVEFSVLLSCTTGAWLIFGRRGGALILVPILALTYGCAEYYVDLFRVSAILPSDLQAAQTGFAVAGGYSFEPTSSILFCIAVLATLACAASFLRDPLSPLLSMRGAPGTSGTGTDERRSGDRPSISALKARRRACVIWIAKNTIAIILSAALGAGAIASALTRAYETDWEAKGLEFSMFATALTFHDYGIIPSFIEALHLQELDEPEGYTSEGAAELTSALAGVYNAIEGQSESRQAAQEQFAEDPPNIVVVMNETFADLSSMDGLGAGYEGPAWFKESKAYARGKLSVSVHGAGTCNTEFELSTGTALSHVGAEVNPFVLYDLSNVPSAPKSFLELGYSAFAIHPELATNWQRTERYPELGFQEFYSQDDFPEDAVRHRGHISDGETYKKVMEVLEREDGPSYVWDLTMSNHGGYDTGLFLAEEMLDYSFGDVVGADDAAAANEYVTSISMSDEEIEAFIKELENFDERTVVVFFGDHHPSFTGTFSEALRSNGESELAQQEELYQTDYAIWANYDIAGWNGICYDAPMNAGELMGYAKNLIGAPMSEYEQAQYASRWWVLTDNVLGYMETDGTWVLMSDSRDIDDVYAKGMELLTAAREQETALPDMGEGWDAAYQDKLVFNVMDWITWFHFQENVESGQE